LLKEGDFLKEVFVGVAVVVQNATASASGMVESLH